MMLAVASLNFLRPRRLPSTPIARAGPGWNVTLAHVLSWIEGWNWRKSPVALNYAFILDPETRRPGPCGAVKQNQSGSLF